METDPKDDVFLTVDEKGGLVEKRITSPYAMREIFSKFTAEDSGEADRRVRLLNIYNGNLPHNPEKLKALNLANIANFNTGDLSGFIDARVSAISDLALDTCPLVELRPLPASSAGPQAARIAEIVADEFSTTVRGGNKLLPCLAGMFRECDLTGLGPVTWASPRDYNPTSLRRGQIKFRADGPITSSDHEVFMFESKVPISYFRRLFTRSSVAEKEGWDVEAVKRYLVSVYISEQPKAANAGDSTGTSTAESALIEMRQNRWIETNQFKSLNLLHALVKETDGKIRHLICDPTPGIEEFLFDKAAVYESFDQCFMWLPASVVEQEARGSRGVASRVAPIADINNRLVCQMYDLGFRGGSVTLISTSPGQHQQQTIVERGPYTVIPADMTVSPNQFNASAIQQLAGLRDLGNNICHNNATGARGVLGEAPERIVSGTERKTKEEVQAVEANRSRGEMALFAARVLVLDMIFREVFRRFFVLVNKGDADLADYPEIIAFKKRCLLQGVPEEALKNTGDLFIVYTNRILVTGGGQAHAAILGQLLAQFGGSFDEQGRNYMTRDIVRYQLGAKSADRYRPENNRDQEPTNAVSFATQENESLKRGGAALAGSDQLHWSHIPKHMELPGAIMQQYRQDPQSIQDPQQILDVLLGVTQHIREHLGYGSRQPGMKALANSVEGQLASMAPVVKGLTMMAGTLERQRASAAKQQEAEMAKLQEAAAGKKEAAMMHDSDNKAALKAREQDLIHEVDMRAVELKHSAKLAEAGVEARDNIARQTARIEQGSAILGFGSGESMEPPDTGEPIV